MSEMTVNNDNQEALEQQAFEERAIAPAVDIYERGNELVVLADMPGLTKDAISVSTEKGVLTIKGDKKESVDRDYTWREWEPNTYFRQFRLGEKINQSKITAEYKQGVLELVLPMAEEQKPRQVDVKVT